MADDNGSKQDKFGTDPLKPLNIKEKPKRPIAVAIEDARQDSERPRVTAAGRGKIAEQILQLAWDNDVKVREDGPLAEMLAHIELDSPIPTDAFLAVAEILSYVYRADGAPDPFDAVLESLDEPPEDKTKDETKDGPA